MGKTDWKAEAKTLKAKLAKLKKELKAAEDSTKAKAKAKPSAKTPATADAPRPSKAPNPASPLAPKGGFPALPLIGGVEFAAASAGVRYMGRTDVMLVRLAPGTTVAGAFTRSATRAACILDCETKLSGRDGSEAGAAILVNSGNANAFTGAAGTASVAALTDAVANALGIPATRVFTSSTGVIGEPLPHDRIIARLPDLVDTLDAGGIEPAARAIMTTDTFPKGATRTATIGDATVTISGIAKGSGMIAPDMATMLCFLATDAKIPAPVLQKILSKGSDKSFNCITVDSDTSTSDTVLMFATGATKHPRVPAEGGAMLRDFTRAVHEVLMDLALMVARDGEGAQKLIQIDVTGAVSAKSAHRIAMSIANSPLVKTAIAGEDANWGRIVMAVGKAGEPADRDLLSVAVGGTWMAREGGVVPGYDETPVVAHMKGRDVHIEVDIGLGRGKATVWTCDLTHGYIDINGSYRS